MLVDRAGIVPKQQWSACLWMDGLGSTVVSVRQALWACRKSNRCWLGTC